MVIGAVIRGATGADGGSWIVTGMAPGRSAGMGIERIGAAAGGGKSESSPKPNTSMMSPTSMSSFSPLRGGLLGGHRRCHKGGNGR